MSLDGSLLAADNSVSSNITAVKTSDKMSDEVSDETRAESSHVSSDWSPLQLSSYNLSKPPPPPLPVKPSLRTETLERHNTRPALRTFSSGRSSAEPLDSGGEAVKMRRSGLSSEHLVTPITTSLSELDLR